MNLNELIEKRAELEQQLEIINDEILNGTRDRLLPIGTKVMVTGYVADYDLDDPYLSLKIGWGDEEGDVDFNLYGDGFWAASDFVKTRED